MDAIVDQQKRQIRKSLASLTFTIYNLANF